MLHLYNTHEKALQRFKPLREPDVRFYACGPTVYNYAHLGNLSTYLVEDIVIRSLRFLGYRVHAVMNITDIDDKTIRDSQVAGEDLGAFTQKYTKVFNEDLEKLSITSFDSQHPISEHIESMVAITQKLIDLEYAYLSEDGSIYYRVSKFSGYEKLAGLDMSGMKSSVRIDNDEYEKDAVADFVLWKAYNSKKDGDNKWVAKLTIDEKDMEIEGRPGWHIECSAVITDVCKGQVDIHMGGCDLIFPHHTNEIAQSQPLLTRKQGKFCGCWMHAGHLLVDNKKMAKSANNFYRLSDIVEKSSHSESQIYRGVRMMRLMSGYRENFNFTFEKLDSSIATLSNFDSFFRRIVMYIPQGNGISRDVRDLFQGCMQEFVSCLEDDIDTVQAVSLVFSFITQCNVLIDAGGLSAEEIGSLIELLRSIDEVFGVMDFDLLVPDNIPVEITRLSDRRIAAKIEKDYDLADELRAQILEAGYEVLDTPTGSTIQKICS